MLHRQCAFPTGAFRVGAWMRCDGQRRTSSRLLWPLGFLRLEHNLQRTCVTSPLPALSAHRTLYHSASSAIEPSAVPVPLSKASLAAQADPRPTNAKTERTTTSSSTVKFGKYEQSAGHTRRSERKNHIQRLSSPWQVRYYYSEPYFSKRQIQKCFPAGGSRQRLDQAHHLRKEVRERRNTALGRLHTLLSTTTLSSPGRKTKFPRTDSLSTLLPMSQMPSKSTQLGKTVDLLGSGDSSGMEHAETKAIRSQEMAPLIVSGGPFLQCPAAGPNVHPLKPTPSLRAPHPTPMAINDDSCAQCVTVMTESDVNDQAEGLDANDYRISHVNHSNGDEQVNETTRDNSIDGNDTSCPNQQPNEQNIQAPNEDKDIAPEESSSSENECKEGFNNEVGQESDMEEAEEQHTPLTYQIPPDVLENALQAPPQTRASYWSQKLYRGPEEEELLLHYCSNMEISERVAKHFLNEKIIGFDIEWKIFGAPDSIKENASLIQLAVENRIALFHIARFPGKTAEELLPPTLKAILESPDAYKVGVAVKGDCTRLEKYFGLEIRGVFELSRLYNLVKYYATDPSKVSNKLVGLAKQVQQHLLLPLYKGEPLIDEQHRGSVRESDWSRPLDYEQIQYAAADAYAGFRLFDVLESKRKKLKPTPPIPRLCDYDNRPALRTAPKPNPKKAKMAQSDIEKVATESLSGLNAEDAEEGFETAVEERAEEEEDEDADSESFSGSSDESGDPDADYIPKRHGRMNLDQRSTGTSTTTEAPTGRIGRVDLSKLTTADPGYPKLPLSSQAGNDTDESEAFDPPSKVRLQRRVPKPAVVQKEEMSSSVPEQLEDEFADPELEEALIAMDFDPPAETANAYEQLDVDMADANTNLEQSDKEAALPTTAPIQNNNEPSLTPLPTTDTTTHTPEYILATTWATTYLSTTIPPPSSTTPPRIRATVPPLRAYHLWHHQRVPLDTIGAHLRDPPLAQSTVSNYIVQAVTMEKLEYREAELVALVGTLPGSLRLGRFAWLGRRLGIVR